MHCSLPKNVKLLDGVWLIFISNIEILSSLPIFEEKMNSPRTKFPPQLMHFECIYVKLTKTSFTTPLKLWHETRRKRAAWAQGDYVSQTHFQFIHHLNINIFAIPWVKSWSTPFNSNVRPFTMRTGAFHGGGSHVINC